jgi:hypothetical protein
MEESKKGEICVRSLPCLTGRGDARRKFSPNIHTYTTFFVIYFNYESVSNTCLIKRTSQLHDDITLVESSL